MTLTDKPTELPLLRRNLAENNATGRCGDVRVEACTWGDEEDMRALGTFDVVLCADVDPACTTSSPTGDTTPPSPRSREASSRGINRRWHQLLVPPWHANAETESIPATDTYSSL